MSRSRRSGAGGPRARASTPAPIRPAAPSGPRQRPHRRLRRLGTSLTATGSALGSLSILAAAASLGVWSDSEPMVIAVFAGAALTALGLGCGAFAGPTARAALAHPAVMVAAALGMWSGFVALFARFPLAALLGPPQTGEGAAWWFAFAAFLAGAIQLRPTRLFPPLVWLMAATAGGVAAIDSGIVRRVAALDVRLMSFDEFQAGFALVLLTIAAVWQARRAMRPVVWGGIAALGLLSLIAAHNRTAMVAIGAAIVVGLPVLRPWTARLAARPVAVFVLTAAVALLPIVLLRALDLQTIAPSLWSRGRLFEALDGALFETMWTPLVGHGWGHFAETLTRDLDLVGLPGPQGAASWGAVWRDMFHSHNAGLEALFAAGLPGLVLRLGLPVAVVVGARASLRPVALAFALAWTGLDAFWFTLPCALAPSALAIAAFSARRRGHGPSRRGLGLTACAVALGLGVASVALAIDGRAASRVAACLPPRDAPAACAEVAPRAELRGDDAALATLITTAIGPAIGRGPDLPEVQRGVMRRLFARAEARQAAGSSAQLGLAMADALAQIAWSDHGRALLPPGETLEQAWPRSLAALARVAPGRIDAWVPYLNFLVGAGHSDDLGRMTAELARAAPQHPVRLWFAGLIDLGAADPATQRRGLVMMRRAMQGGIERLMTVDARIRAKLERVE